jgi:hypothetical protein
LKLNFLYFAPDTEFEFPREMQALGVPASLRGHEGKVEAMLSTCSTSVTACSAPAQSPRPRRHSLVNCSPQEHPPRARARIEAEKVQGEAPRQGWKRTMRRSWRFRDLGPVERTRVTTTSGICADTISR